MTVGDSIFEQAITSVERTEEAIKSALSIVAKCPAGECPVCETARDGFEAMLESINYQRSAIIATTVEDPALARDEAITMFVSSESFQCHVSFVLDLIGVAHETFELISKAEIALVLGTGGGGIREAAEDVIARCDQAEAMARAKRGPTN